MASTQCSVCDEEIEVAGRPRLGQKIICSHCGSQLEVVAAEPLELEIAQEEDDTWEDDDLEEEELEELDDADLEEDLEDDGDDFDDELEDDFEDDEFDDDVDDFDLGDDDESDGDIEGWG
jgi:lysine biosynthesis protein LysW